MTNQYYIGVDVSKKTLDIYALKEQEKLFYLCISNDTKGFKTFDKECKKHGVIPQESILCLENTGLYGMLFAAWATEKKYKVWIENPIAIKQSRGLVRGKSDKKDAERIAQYAHRFQDRCRIWIPPRKVITELKHLLTVRNQLINAKKSLLTPLKESVSIINKKIQKTCEKTVNPAIESIKKSIKKVEKEINNLIKSDEQIAHMTDILTSINGIGIQIAIAFIVATNEFKQVKNGRALACYVGVAPFEHNSGTSVRGKSRVSVYANKSLKAILHMGALSVIKNSEEFRSYYNRKVQEGKSKMLVINAIKNKQVLRMYACIRDNRKYEKNYTLKLA